MKGSTFIWRVVLQNYKSIAACDVRLGPLMFLVGPNGAGKSNFLDALRFVAEALRTSLVFALRVRGGYGSILTRGKDERTHFGIRLDFTLRDGTAGHYAFRIGKNSRGSVEVESEECVTRKKKEPKRKAYFRVSSGKVTTSASVAPAVARDRLYLVNASGLPEFRPVYEALSAMGFYNLSPEQLREPQEPSPDALLARDGSNITSVLAQLPPEVLQCIEEYLAAVTPGVERVEAKVIGSKETLEFRLSQVGTPLPQRFLAANMSDGTLRALGILVALFQSKDAGELYVPLVGIEEPELALHPAAAGVLRDGLQEASLNTQVLVTSHSPDLLDDDKLDTESLLAVSAEKGTTQIGPIDDASLSVLRKNLYTAGELLRLDQFVPNEAAISSAVDAAQNLFDKGDI